MPHADAVDDEREAGAPTQVRVYALPRGSVSVSIDDRAIADWVDARVPPGDTADTIRTLRLRSSAPGWVLEESGRNYVFRGTRSSVATRLLERLNELACFAAPSLTVHSGLVGDVAGRGVWIPAASGGGKTTLTAQLVLSGLMYASDEVVSVGDHGELTGWPKWLGVKPGSRDVLRALAPERADRVCGEGQWMVPPGTVGDIVRGPVTASVVALPRYRAGTFTKVRSVTPAEALAQIVPQVFNLRRHGVGGVEALASALRRSQVCVRITYGDGWDASRRLIDLLGPAPRSG